MESFPGAAKLRTGWSLRKIAGINKAWFRSSPSDWRQSGRGLGEAVFCMVFGTPPEEENYGEVQWRQDAGCAIDFIKYFPSPLGILAAEEQLLMAIIREVMPARSFY